ncbi:sensor histidine kinase [Demequina oxidasica]|uniref:sensor histidine kinase n=1 Tax=Demequina oxidasica TaxID=676199 RepID=UPI0007830F2A|nr:ATP-binding protein [Demequina oxidasica]
MTETSRRRIARPLERERAPSQWWRGLVGTALLVIAGVMIANRSGAEGVEPWVIPSIVFLVGLVLVWSPLDRATTDDARRPNLAGLFRRDAMVRLVLGLAMTIGALWWFATWDFTEDPVRRSIVVPLVVLGALALVLAPWWLRLIRQVGVERQERVREFERAEIAAHLHDSVLQTLTLIRAKADDPDAVTRLARAQERDLRAYLYQDRRTEEESVATALELAVNAVEDAQGVVVDLVSVGDAPTDSRLWAAVKAAREATSNAARHGIGPVSVYAELTADAYEIFVRDSGPGFDPNSVPADRLGIKHSIIGRVERQGGAASIQSSPGGRTEVTISVPRELEK